MSTALGTPSTKIPLEDGYEADTVFSTSFGDYDRYVLRSFIQKALGKVLLVRHPTKAPHWAGTCFESRDLPVEIFISTKPCATQALGHKLSTRRERPEFSKHPELNLTSNLRLD